MGGQVDLTVSGRLAWPVQEVEQLATRLCESTSRAEPGTLTYAWYIDEEAEAFSVQERYADTASFTAHMTSLRDTGEMRALGRALHVQRVDVWSGFDPLVEEHLRALHPTFWRRVGKPPE